MVFVSGVSIPSNMDVDCLWLVEVLQETNSTLKQLKRSNYPSLEINFLSNSTI